MIEQATIKRIIKGLLILAAGIFLYIYFSAFLPILLVLLTAMIFEPPILWLKKILNIEKRILPVIIVFTSFIVAAAFTLYITLTKVAKSVYELADSALQLTSKLIDLLSAWLQSLPNTVFVTLFYFITFFLFSLDFPRLTHVFFSLFRVETSIKLPLVFQQMSKFFSAIGRHSFFSASVLLSLRILVCCLFHLGPH